MGYYVTLVDADFIIPAAKRAAAFAALKRLNGPEYDEYKVVSNTPGDEARFPWMPTLWDETCTSIGDVLELLGFEFDYLRNADTAIYRYDGKWSDHIELFLSTLAPFVDDGSFLIFGGEQPMDFWKYVVEDGELVCYNGKPQWVRDYRHPIA